MAETPRQRKKLWQLEHRFHCSVIGTCLSLTELRTLCRKAGIPIPEAFSDYELHCSFVTAVAQPGKLAKTTHKYLDRKYAIALRRARTAKDGEALRAFWHEARDAGDIAGPYWAAVTHPCADERFLFYLFGDIHMLSHLQGARIRLDMARLARLTQETTALRHALTKLRERFHARLAEKQARIDELQAQAEYLPILRRRLQAAEHQLRNWRSGAAQARLERRLAETKALCNRLAARCERLEMALAARHGQNQGETPTPRQTSSEPDLPARRGEETPAIDFSRLEGRCILYVGGLKSQWPFLRAWVERCKAELITHDGGREHGRTRLDGLLARADWVICPLDQVSHDAVQRIKAACRRYDKPCLLLSNASLSAFVRALGQLVQNQEEKRWRILTADT